MNARDLKGNESGGGEERIMYLFRESISKGSFAPHCRHVPASILGLQLLKGGKAIVPFLLLLLLLLTHHHHGHIEIDTYKPKETEYVKKQGIFLSLFHIYMYMCIMYHVYVYVYVYVCMCVSLRARARARVNAHLTGHCRYIEYLRFEDFFCIT